VGVYAKSTSVAAEKSRGEIERVLLRYGADQFVYGWCGEGAMIAFRMNERQIRLTLPMPDRNAREFTHSPGRGNKRKSEAAMKAWEQATRQRWRALLLVIKAKLESIEVGISTFDDEFLAHILLPNGKTVGEFTIPQIVEGYVPRALPFFKGGKK